jgi:hypothetical protein
MYLVEWRIVDGGLSLAEELKGAKGERARIDCERRFAQDLADGWQIAPMRMGVAVRVFVIVRVSVIMMIVIVIMRMGMIVRGIGFVAVMTVQPVGVVAAMIVLRVGIIAADQHACFSRADAAAIYRVEYEGCAEIEGRGGLLEERGRDAGVDQGAEQHVSTEPGKAFEIANTHDGLSVIRISEGRFAPTEYAHPTLRVGWGTRHPVITLPAFVAFAGTIAPITTQDDKIGLLAWSTVSGSTSFMEPER